MRSIALGMLATVVAFGIATAHAGPLLLKVHHPLPTSSTAHQKVLLPWCKKISRESGGAIECQIFPAMQLGGAVPQLYDQVKDGVVDVIWTIPGYAAGRFPKVEVFELPFMIRGTEAASRAVWDYVEKYGGDEFADVKPLAFHVHAGGVFHTVDRPIRRRADLHGMKMRAPTRQSNRYMAVLGATPVGMPVPQVPEALSKGVIDGALLPYEVVPAVKADELTKYHSGPDASQPAIYTSVFILAMNRARYDSLPPALKAVIERNSGIDLSAQIGRIFAAAEAENKRRMPAGSINVIPADEIARWRTAAQPIVDGWVRDISASGADGKALLAAARQLISGYEK